MLPRFDRLATALSHDHNFQAVLALVYADILEFHRRAYKFVRRKCEFLVIILLASLTNDSMGHLLRLDVGWLRVEIWQHSEDAGVP